MKRQRFSEEQIIAILKEHDAGVPVAELCRKHGVSDSGIYKWKAKFGGMEGNYPRPFWAETEPVGLFRRRCQAPETLNPCRHGLK